MEDVKQSTGGKSKKQKAPKPEVVIDESPAVVESLAAVDEREMEKDYKEQATEEWVKPESDYTPTDWAAVNNPPEPGVVDVAVAPKGPDVVRRGFTTLQMAVAFRNSLENRGDYLVVEVRDGFGMNGPILCHYVIHKSEEL
jgi:hypothetical protein